MPRQRTHYSRRAHFKARFLPDHSPQRLGWFQHASGLPRAEIARRLGVSPMTVWRWSKGISRPNYRHLKARVALADDLGLGYLFRD